MRLADIKTKIKSIRFECNRAQKQSKSSKPLNVVFPLNKNVSFIAINSGFDFVLSISKKEKKWKIVFAEFDTWIKKEYNVKESFDIDPKNYDLKIDVHKNHTRLYMLDREVKKDDIKTTAELLYG